MSHKIKRHPSEVLRCLLVLQEELTDVLKILAKREKDVIFDHPGTRTPATGHVSYPCKPDPTGQQSRQLIADIFVAVAKVVVPKRKPHK